MAIAKFGNFQVDMTNDFFLDPIVGNNFDGDPQFSTTTTQVVYTFPSGAAEILTGNFTLGMNSPITGFEIDNPGSALVVRISGLIGLTVDVFVNSTDDQLDEMLFGQVNEVFTQGFADTLIGDDGSEIAHSGAGNDIIQGNGGDDVLDGGPGADQMTGGLGNDTYFVDNAGDQVIEAADEGTDAVKSSISYILGPNVENLTLTGTAGINGTGNELNNVIVGNAAANTLSGGDGGDTLNGGAGADSLIGGAGNDTLHGGAGNDKLDGGADADQMDGGAGNDTYAVNNAGDQVIETPSQGADTVRSSISFDLNTKGANVENLTLTETNDTDGTGNGLNNVLTGNAGNNHLNGLGGNDTLNGAAGNDTLDGGTGADNMFGGLGDDTYVVDNSGDKVIEGLNAGGDEVQSSISYILGPNLEKLTLTGTANINATGNGLDNLLTGNAGNNVLNGGMGTDTMIGGAGNDTLNGGLGADILQGGDGDDKFIFDLADTQVAGGADSDTLKLAGSGQHLDLSGKAGTVYTGLEAIDLTGIGNNSLSLTEQNVVDISSTTDELTVNGNAGDSISSTGQGWVQGVDQTIGGILYHNYTSGAAALHVQDHVTTNLS